MKEIDENTCESRLKTLKYSTAIHEAGHAIALINSGQKFAFITNNEHDKQDFLGFIRIDSRIVPKNLININSFKDYCIFLLAGEICTMKYENIRTGHDLDFKDFVFDIMCSTCSMELIGDLQEVFNIVEAYHLSRKKKYSVEGKIYRLFDNLIDITEELFTNSDGEDTLLWRQVIKIADELVIRKILYYTDVLQIIEELNVTENRALAS